MLARMSDPADIQRLVGDLVREGTVESVDLAKGTLRFRTGDLITGDIPWLAARSGATKSWSPPSVGEQGVMFCPEGDTARGFFLPGLFSDAHGAPSSEDVELTRYADGAIVSYNAATHALEAILPAGATVRIEADGGLSIKGDVAIDGDVSVTGKIDADGEITGNAIKLSAHKHGQVQPGSGKSGVPE
jgi:phage baseplate assembly protein V